MSKPVKPELIWLTGYFAGFNVIVDAGDKSSRGKIKHAFRRGFENRKGVVDVGFNETAEHAVWIVTLDREMLGVVTLRELRKIIDNVLDALPKELGPYSYRIGVKEVGAQEWRRMVTGRRWLK